MPTRIPSEKVMMRSSSTRLPADPRMNPGGIEARRRPSATSSSTTLRRSTTSERSRAAPLRLASSPFVSSVSGRGQPTDQPTGQPTTVAHTHPSRPLAKFSGLMDMGKYSAVIRWETRICVWAQSKYAGYEIFPANHTAVSSLVHQNTECGRTLSVGDSGRPLPGKCRDCTLSNNTMWEESTTVVYTVVWRNPVV